MKKENCGEFEWGSPHEADLWDGYLQVLIKHAQEKAEK